MISDETFDAEGDLSAKQLPKWPVSRTTNKSVRLLLGRRGDGLVRYPKKINDDFGVAMTYMEVRFLVDDLDLTLVDEEEPVEEGEDEGNGETGLSAEHLFRRMPGQRGYKSNSIQ